jgi:2-keto-4-pentenoate hydratase/2-oxohepta-3-ene-1,7-dioic acid hydratase in catechol pathway
VSYALFISAHISSLPLSLRTLHRGWLTHACLSCPRDMIFTCAKLISFLSQGTTLPPGTVIITGTPAGVGFGKKPPAYLHDGDEFVVELLPHVGSLVSVFKEEK